MPSIAVVVPTIRQQSYEEWLAAWRELLMQHQAYLVTVFDGQNARVRIDGYGTGEEPECHSWDGLMEEEHDLICKFTPAVRNLGLAAVAKLLPNVEYIVTLDDDTAPEGDTIQDHVDALGQRVPISWISLCSEYMRGFPYGVRGEAPVMVSHGVWSGLPDLDAPTQLTGAPDRPVYARAQPIPKGIFAPLCGMNIAFRRRVLPFAYWAPTVRLPGAERFDDIWMGLYLKRACDQRNWAILSGRALVKHDRASDVFKNLGEEARGIEINETLWTDLDHPPEAYRDFFDDYALRRRRWQRLVSRWLEESQPSTTSPSPPQGEHPRVR